MSAAPGLTTSDPSYYSPLRAKITVMDNFAANTLVAYDSFNPSSSPVKILQAQLSLGVNQNGTFGVFIEDDQGAIDRTKFGCGNKVLISAGKTTNVSYPLMAGYARNLDVLRDDTGILYYHLTGYGSQILFSERIIDFQKLAARITQGSNAGSTVDQTMLANNLFKTVLEGTSILPLGTSQTLQQQGQFTENGIDPRVNNFIGGLVSPLIQASTVLGQIADLSGAIWGVQNDDVFLRFPSAVHSGVTIKGTGVDPNDLADKTSYITGGYGYSESIDQSRGFANRIWLKGGAIANNPTTSSSSKTSSTDLFNKDIAVEIIPSSAQLKNLALTLSRAGTGGAPGTPNQFVTGAIIQDRGTASPSGAKIADFAIPLSSIPATPTSVFDINYKWYVATLQPLNPYWIVLYAKGTSSSDTVLWHNDGDTTTPNRFSATRQVVLDPATEARTQYPLKGDTTGWAVSSTGPIYTHDFFENVRVLTEASDPLSMNRWGANGGACEAIIDVPWINDNQTMQIFASAVLASTAKPVRQYTLQGVTVPNNMVFMPGTLVDLIDPLGGTAPPKSLSVEIQQVTYDFTAASASSGSTGASTQQSAPSGTAVGSRLAHPMGQTAVDLLCLSYYDFLIDSVI